MSYLESSGPNVTAATTKSTQSGLYIGDMSLL